MTCTLGACGGKVADDLLVYFLFLLLVLFFFFRWIIRRYPGSFVLLGVCGNIFSPLSEQLMEGTDCANFFFTHLTWCYL